MQFSDSLVSLTSARGLPEYLASDRTLIWLDQAECWYIPASNTVFGERDTNVTDVYYAFKGGREVEEKGTYLAILSDVLVSPKGLVFAKDGKLLYESVYPWQLENFTGQFGADLELSDECLAPKVGDLTTLDAAFHCREGGETGYFHFINSILPRLALWKRIEGSGKTLPLMASIHAPFTKQMFALLGVENVATPGKWYKVKQLFYPSPFIVEGDHFTRTRFSSALLKEMLNPLIKKFAPASRDRRLYLSRGDVTIRRVSNEDEVIKLFKDKGFESITVGGMSVEDQISLFASASHLVSPHGAGLSNMIFMPPDGSVTEILSPSRLWPTFRTLATRHGLNYHAIIGHVADAAQTEEKGVGNEDFDCDLQAVRFHLQQLRL